MASKKRKPKKKPRAVRAWGVFLDGRLIQRPVLRVYNNLRDAMWWAAGDHSRIRRVHIEVEP